MSVSLSWAFDIDSSPTAYIHSFAAAAAAAAAATTTTTLCSKKGSHQSFGSNFVKS